ncbi:hypothetical protein DSL72_007972 [Monilinia vaccinii-corymbosi]|uniref:Uncharacterized protein n=1 Tax=Monilinia vaccinii-corymbosi TaxID=61207 RepID=A0A8A3PIL1_9HELO|nr:hypothetical protein DSL72_007972 [Monilinia vaccinii-corymbosi]
MDDVEHLPEGIKKIHLTLSPYIKQRQDTLLVRRVLAAHLSSNVNAGESILTSTNLSLAEPTSEATQGLGFPGVQNEYLRSLQANLKAQKDFATISTQQDEVESHSEIRARTHDQAKEVSLRAFLDLEKQRKRQERFRIIQDLVDQLAQKPAATPDYLEPKSLEVLREAGSLPPVPPIVLAPLEHHQESERIDLKSLVDRLEKSVLRAQLLLKKEQKLLAKVRASATTSKDQRQQDSCRQLALEITRNELINWIEMELGKAGDSSAAPEGQDSSIPKHKGKEYIDSQLPSIKQIYAQYLEIRKRLIIAATEDLATPFSTAVEAEDSSGTLVDEPLNDFPNTTNVSTYPYLEDLVLISNEQKSITQQRSYLTGSLTRQHKEAGKDLDKLVDESHLLPAYPMPAVTSQRKRLGEPISFEVNISNSDKPSLSSRAKAWVFAAESSSISTKEAVLERLEDGESALAEAYQTLNDLQILLGCLPEGQGVDGDVVSGRQKLGISNIGGVWSTLDGNLGFIRTEDSISD